MASSIDRVRRRYTDDAGTHDEVRFQRDDGAIVEHEQLRHLGGVRSSVTVTKEGVKESWTFDDSFAGDDRGVHQVRRGEQIETDEALSHVDFLAKRGELFTDRSEGVAFGPLKLAYTAGYTSAVVLSSGRNVAGEPRHLLASLGVHAAFPFPGEHWDEGQIAILDGAYQKIIALTMPKASEPTHLDVRFDDASGVDGRPQKIITYEGYMEDDAGKLRFVEAKYVLEKKAVEEVAPSLWDRLTGKINDAVGFDQNAKLLRELEVPVSSIRIDGQEMMTIERSIGAIDDGARFNNLPNSLLTAINYAPASSPLLSLVDPAANETRYRFDATLLNDGKNVLGKLLPQVLRRGTLSAHYVVGEDGKRRTVDERMIEDGPPISSKLYTWEFQGEAVAIMKRELVRYRDADGHVELGFRETITRT